MANASIKEKVEAIYKNPKALANAKDYLNMLAVSEGTAGRGNDGYNIMFRGAEFSDYKAHPNQKHEYIDKNGRKGSSTAAGRYQFLKGTYDGMAKQLGISDFSPESQDKVAIALMLEKGVDFSDGADLATNVNRINNVWTSLTGSTLGAKYHSVRDPQFLLDAFNKSRIARGANPVTTKWGNTTYQTSPNALANMSMPDTSQWDKAAQSYLESIGMGGRGFLGDVINRIRNKTYADSGYIPWNMYTGNKLTVSSNPVLTQGNLDAMQQRLQNTNPNVQYGISTFGNGMHPTVAIKNPDGTVSIGTDVPTTIAVAPALSDGGVPVEDAKQTAAQVAADRENLLRPATGPAYDPTGSQSGTTDFREVSQVPNASTSSYNLPAPNTAPSKTVASDASATSATTPQASDAGASQAPASSENTTANTPVVIQYRAPEEANLMLAGSQPTNFGISAWDTLQKASQAEANTGELADNTGNAQITQIGGWVLPTTQSALSSQQVPVFPVLGKEGAEALLQSTPVKQKDLPKKT